MYKVVYKYLANNSTKVAYVSAPDRRAAEDYVKQEFFVDVVKIQSVTNLSHGTVAYLDGRF